MNKIYICLPVFNGESYIKKCITSLIAQSFINIEILIFDSGSTDNTLSLAKSFNDSRISIITSTSLLSINQNWQRINDYFLSDSFGDDDFITIIGHDDFFDNEFLKEIDVMTNQFKDASIYTTHFNLVDNNDRIIRQCKPFATKYDYVDLFFARCWNHIDVYATGYVFRINDFKKVGGINTSYPLLLYSDDLLLIKLSKLSYLATSKSIRYFYRLHNSTSNSNSLSKSVSQLKALQRFILDLRKIFEFKEMKDVYYWTLGLLVYRNIIFYNNGLFRLFRNKDLNICIEDLDNNYVNINHKRQYFYSLFGKNYLVYFIKSLFHFIKNL